MTENIPQTSASERVEEARAALAESREASAAVFQATGITPRDTRVERALRALITPPAVGESEESIAERIADGAGIDWDEAYDIALPAVRAGIQSAHESWEPADVPSQEFMLRHLDILHEELTTAGGRRVIFILQQDIDLEVI